MKKFIRWIQDNHLWSFIITFLVIGVVSLIYVQEKRWERKPSLDDYGIYSQLEFPPIDFRQTFLAQPEQSSDDIVIVSITEQAIKRYQNEWGRWSSESR